MHRLVVAFRHRTFAESEDRLQMYTPGAGRIACCASPSFDVRGPFNATGVSQTSARQHIFAACYPKSAAEETPLRAHGNRRCPRAAPSAVPSPMRTCRA